MGCVSRAPSPRTRKHAPYSVPTPGALNSSTAVCPARSWNSLRPPGQGAACQLRGLAAPPPRLLAYRVGRCAAGGSDACTSCSSPVPTSGRQTWGGPRAQWTGSPAGRWSPAAARGRQHTREPCHSAAGSSARGGRACTADSSKGGRPAACRPMPPCMRGSAESPARGASAPRPHTCNGMSAWVLPRIRGCMAVTRRPCFSSAMLPNEASTLHSRRAAAGAPASRAPREEHARSACRRIRSEDGVAASSARQARPCAPMKGAPNGVQHSRAHQAMKSAKAMELLSGVLSVTSGRPLLNECHCKQSGAGHPGWTGESGRSDRRQPTLGQPVRRASTGSTCRAAAQAASGQLRSKHRAPAPPAPASRRSGRRR